jgi:outer membrane protein OmpA-like peptidoglycan-associated protein
MEVARQEDSLLVTMSEAVLFDTNSAALKPQAQSVLGQTADVMIRYPDSDLLVKGHTDSTGSEKYNQELSERRAKSVQNFLIAKGVASQRITAIGFGKTMPIASNDTLEGRAQNRRVEIEIKPRAAAS